LAGNSNSHGNYFAAMNFKNTKDGYSEKLAEKVQSGVSYFVEMTADNMPPLSF
jgi:hypothetical protein